MCQSSSAAQKPADRVSRFKQWIVVLVFPLLDICAYEVVRQRACSPEDSTGKLRPVLCSSLHITLQTWAQQVENKLLLRHYGILVWSDRTCFGLQPELCGGFSNCLLNLQKTSLQLIQTQTDSSLYPGRSRYEVWCQLTAWWEITVIPPASLQWKILSLSWLMTPLNRNAAATLQLGSGILSYMTDRFCLTQYWPNFTKPKEWIPRKSNTVFIRYISKTNTCVLVLFIKLMWW